MLQQQVKKDLRLLDIANDIYGKHEITEDIIKKLKAKHPKTAEIKQPAITSTPETNTENVIFEDITQNEIASSARSSSVYGGLTQTDMETWR